MSRIGQEGLVTPFSSHRSYFIMTYNGKEEG